MKKSLIALAALATVATAAQAQSSVTIYGIVDSGVARVTNVDSTQKNGTYVGSGLLSTSRFGFKGSEDLGGGLKANFLLENEFTSDAGTQSDPLFKRGSWVQLDKSGIGSVTLGRQNRLDYAATASIDPFGASNVGGFVSAGYLGSRAPLTTRINNAVTLQSAKFNGLSVAYQRELGEAAGDNKVNSTDAYNVDYTNGNLRLSATQAKSYNSSTTAQDEKSTLLFASYDFGVAKPVIGHITSQAATDGVKVKVTLAGVAIPVKANSRVVLGYYDIKNAYKVANDDGKIYSVNYVYDLSKRTSLYALYAKSSVEGTASIAVSNFSEAKAGTGNAAGLSTSVAGFGVRHTF